MPRGHGGREVTDEKIISILRQSDDPFLFTGEVADEIGMTRQGAHRRLKELASDEQSCVRKKGTDATIWWASSRV